MWDKETWDRISRKIDGQRAEMVKMQAELSARPAIGPTNGGAGEVEKVEYLRAQLKELDLETIECRAPDNRVPCGYRPSLIGLMPGKDHSRTVWIMTHVDVVPPGPLELWTSDPYKVIEKEGKLFGRGVEDNQQEMVSSYYSLRALKELGLKPVCDAGLVLVADEETGSHYGIDYVLGQEKRFRPNDLILVPDAGNADGSHIEIAEKSIAWLKFVVTGRQTHGSSPEQGRNAHRAGAKMMLQIDKVLHDRYTGQDLLFSPPGTTIEPTKKEANVPNINTIPGEDIFYFDCRILPQYPVQEFLNLVVAEATKLAQELGVGVKVTTEQFEQAAPPTSMDAPVVKALSRAVKDVYDVETKPIGIGGGTVAAFFRRAGLPAAVWGRFQGAAHQPNEFCIIESMVNDAKVYAHILGQSA